MKTGAWLIAVLALSLLNGSAIAQDNYPANPIRLVIGYPAGGDLTNVLARLLAQSLSTQMNGNVVVENRVGASGNIGADYVAKSKPDGYTVLLNTGGVILSRAFGEKLNYDVLNDLAPVTLAASAPQVLYVNLAVPASNLSEFIAYVKANPGKLAYGSSGVGGTSHLASLLFLQTNGLSALHVPYKGSELAALDVVSGRIQFAMQGVAAVAQLVKDKRVKALAFTGLRRSPLLPDLPTAAETMPGFEISSWFGIMVPVKTPPAIAKRLNTEIIKALQDPEVQAKLAQQGAETMGTTPEAYANYLRSELDRWTQVIKTAGIKLE
jgi:tripartite-type tricarboxylate transporter receptor subunit TctC